MNLDFSLEPLFSWYVVLLLVSGIVMFVMGITNAARQSIGWRIFGLVANRGLEPVRHAPVPEAGKTN